MAKFCPSCGKSLADDAQFCDGCGAVQSTATHEPQGQPVTAEPVGDNGSFTAEDVEKNKGISAVAYLGILFFIPLVVAPDSKFARFHSNQGLLLLIAAVAAQIVVWIVTAILGWISWVLALLGTIVGVVAWVGTVALVIIGIINAVNGQAKELPVIGKFKLIK